jgi:crotonobetainyl-CoA:carnitine CoA-transferase CaiB-like acyl-CoA transferase
VYTSLECCSAILAALYQREQTGLGQSIDVSMCETMLYVNEHLHWELSDMRDDLDDEVPSFAPSDFPVLPTGEGHTVVVSGHPAARGAFEQYIAAMGRPELASDPRFATVSARRANLAALVDEMRVWAMTFTDLDKIEAVFADNGLAMGVLRSSAEVAGTEWAQSRDAIAEISDRGDGIFRVPNSPWKFSGAVTGVRGIAAYRGEHNREVLHELLDLSDSEIDALETNGVLTSRVPKRT